jgi:hypothetical protein
MNKPTSAGFPSRLAVTYRAVSDLIPDPRNARTHPKRQIDQIRVRDGLGRDERGGVSFLSR